MHSAKGAKPPRTPALTALSPQSLTDAKIHPRDKRSLANVVVFSQLKQGWSPVPVWGRGWAVQQSHTRITPAHPLLSLPCPNGLGAQPGPQGAAIARGVLPCQGRGYGSGSLRHLEKNGDICSHPAWAARSPEPSPPDHLPALPQG